MSYNEKYIKYNEKCKELEMLIDFLQKGGQNNETLRKLMKINKKLKEKGLSYWIDEDGKILAKDILIDDAKRKFLKKVTKDINEYIGKNVANVNIHILPDQLEDDETGVIEIFIEVVTIKKMTKNISLNLRNDKNSIIRIYYRPNELDRFKLTHIKIFAEALLNGIIKKTDPFKYYHLNDLDDVVDL